MDNRPIGIFDSGVGGLTVFKEIQKLLPNENYIYIGDTANFPYGSKSKETIIELSKKRIENLRKWDAKLIVIACGTATSQALEELQKIYSIPILGIITPTITYLKEKNIKKIGVIGTTGTIRSKGWQKQIEKNMDNVTIQCKACPLLASMAEEGWTENEIAKLVIHEYLKDIKNIEALILGCTHYPLFESVIKQEIDPNVLIINTGKMVANEVKKYILQNHLENNENKKPNTQIYLTDLECNFVNVAKKLLQETKLNLKKIE